MSTDRVRQIDLPAAARGRSTLERLDYTDAFVVTLDDGWDRTPEQWARAIIADAPARFRVTAPVTWRALGLRHGSPLSERHVLGWPVRRSTSHYVLLGARSHLGMPAELLVELHGRELLFATFAMHRNRVIRAVWAAITPRHQRVVAGLIGRAARAPA